MTSTEEAFRKWIEVMGGRWNRINAGCKIIRQDFGPVNVVFDRVGISVDPKEPIGDLLPFLEEARFFIKKTLEEERHEAAKRLISLFREELRRDLAEAELSGEMEDFSS